MKNPDQDQKPQTRKALNLKPVAKPKRKPVVKVPAQTSLSKDTTLNVYQSELVLRIAGIDASMQDYDRQVDAESASAIARVEGWVKQMETEKDRSNQKIADIRAKSDELLAIRVAMSQGLTLINETSSSQNQTNVIKLAAKLGE